MGDWDLNDEEDARRVRRGSSQRFGTAGTARVMRINRFSSEYGR